MTNHTVLIGALAHDPQPAFFGPGVTGWQATLAGHFLNAAGEPAFPWFIPVVAAGQLAAQLQRLNLKAGDVLLADGYLDNASAQGEAVLRVKAEHIGRLPSPSPVQNAGNHHILLGGHNEISLSGFLQRAGDLKPTQGGELATSRICIPTLTRSGQRKNFVDLRAWREQAPLLGRLPKGQNTHLRGQLVSGRYDGPAGRQQAPLHVQVCQLHALR